MLCATPASAQLDTTAPSTTPINIPVDTYNPRQLPVVYTKSNAIKNSVGQIVQQTCLRNGKAAGACAIAAVAAGGVGIARLSDYSWSEIGTRIGGGVAGGAVTGAIGTCLTGAAAGVWAGGVGAIPGCMGGLVAGALWGGAFGGITGAVSMTMDDAVKMDADGNLTGDGVKGSQGKPTTNPTGADGSYPFVNEVYYGQDQYDHLLKACGINRECVVRDSQGAYRKGIVLSFVPFPTATDQLQSSIGDVVKTGYYDSPKPTASRGSNMYPCGYGGTCQSMLWTNIGGTTASACKTAGSKNQQCLAFVSTTKYGQANQVPTMTWQPVATAPAWAGAFGPQISPEQFTKQISDRLAAAIANASHKAAGGDAGSAAYDDAHPITEADVKNFYDNNPVPRMTLGDVYKPLADLSSGGGTKESPLTNPVQVEVTNPGTSGSTGASTGTKENPTVTEEKADKDLDEELGGSVGNPIQPVIDFITGPLAPFFSPKFNKVEAACPVFTVDSSTFFQWFIDHPMNGQKGGDAAVQQQAQSFFKWKSDSLCTFFDSHYSSIQLISTLVLAICAVYWFFGVKG